jgi:hypothetical protein
MRALKVLRGWKIPSRGGLSPSEVSKGFGGGLFTKKIPEIPVNKIVK